MDETNKVLLATILRILINLVSRPSLVFLFPDNVTLRGRESEQRRNLQS